MMNVTESSAIGLNHERMGLPNQDAVRVHPVTPDTFVIAVADGHGSSRHADVGARLAVEIAVHRLRELWSAHQNASEPLATCEAVLREVGVGSILSAWRRSVEAFLAVEPGRSRIEPRILKPFGTTLLAALVCPEGALLMQLGDGCIWFLMQGRVEQLRTESPGQGIGEETESLCLRNAEHRVIVRRVSRPVGIPATLIVASDGFQKSYPTDAGAETFLRDVDMRYRSGSVVDIAAGLPAWARSMARTASGDDTTMVLAHWEGEALETTEPASPHLATAAASCSAHEDSGQELVEPTPSALPWQQAVRQEAIEAHVPAGPAAAVAAVPPPLPVAAIPAPEPVAAVLPPLPEAAVEAVEPLAAIPTVPARRPAGRRRP